MNKQGWRITSYLCYSNNHSLKDSSAAVAKTIVNRELEEILRKSATTNRRVFHITARWRNRTTHSL